MARSWEGYEGEAGRRLAEEYDALDAEAVARAMRWAEPARDVAFARRAAGELMACGPLHCVWTGRRLADARFDIDHGLPWAAWPCDDLWNLLPEDRKVNQHMKRDRLPSAAAREASRGRMLDWWERGYRRRDEATAERLLVEAAASLPLGGDVAPGAPVPLEAVFAGLRARRLAIRADQRVEEWTPGT